MKCDVLLLTNLYPPIQIGGYEIAARDVAEGLSKRGLNVCVAATDYRVAEVTYEEKNIFRKLKLVSSWFGDYPVNNRLENVRHNFKTMQGLIDELQPKLIYAWNQANLGAGPLVAANSRGTPILHHIMGYDLLSYRSSQRTLFGTLKGKVRSLMDHTWSEYKIGKPHLRNIVFLSRYMQDFYLHEGVKPEFTEVIYPGVEVADIKAKSNYRLKNNNVEVVYVGQLAVHKGVMEVRQALEEVKKLRPSLNIRLSLIGSGDKEFVDALLEPSTIQIDHKGFVGRSQLYESLCHYDIGVFSSTWNEPFGIAQIELMSAGLPVVASATGGAAEPLEDQVNALVYDSKNPEDLTRKFLYLVDEYDRIAAGLGKNARETAQLRFSLENMHVHIYKVISSFINSGA